VFTIRVYNIKCVHHHSGQPYTLDIAQSQVHNGGGLYVCTICVYNIKCVYHHSGQPYIPDIAQSQVHSRGSVDVCTIRVHTQRSSHTF